MEPKDTLSKPKAAEDAEYAFGGIEELVDFGENTSDVLAQDLNGPILAYYPT